MISVEKLTKKYGKHTALNEVNITIDKEGIIGIIGPNGSGKSTLFGCLLGLINATSGNVDILHNIKLGASLDADGFLKNLSGKNNLEIIKKTNGVTDTYFNEIVEKLQLDEYYNRRFGGYSLGMKQKISLAAALLHQPDVLVLDEPLNGLDVEAQRNVLQIIKAEYERGVTVLVSSHTLSELEKLCTHFAFIQMGSIKYFQSKEQALKDHASIDEAYTNIFSNGF